LRLAVAQLRAYFGERVSPMRDAGLHRPARSSPAGGSMLTMHVPKRFTQVSRSFIGTDPKAWTVLIVAVCSLAAIIAFAFSR
jgi:hypothetical protein